MRLKSSEDIQKLGRVLLETGSLMQSNGACSARIRITVERIAGAFGLTPHMFITQRALILTLLDQEHLPVFNSNIRTAPVGVNFKIISGISRMSFHIADKKWGIPQIESELERLVGLPHYPRLLILTAVGLADAGFCFIGDGNIKAMAVSFIATFAGLFIRQEATKKHFNFYLCVFFAALTASFVAGAFCWYFPHAGLKSGFATSVLFLIPGVPLINSFTDIVDGNLLNGIVRALNGLFISFMIAIGLIISLLIFNL